MAAPSKSRDSSHLIIEIRRDRPVDSFPVLLRNYPPTSHTILRGKIFIGLKGRNEELSAAQGKIEGGPPKGRRGNVRAADLSG